MYITSRLQDDCCNANHHMQVQSRKQGVESATTFWCSKKAKALQKLPHRLPLTSHWQEIEHMPTALKEKLMKGRLEVYKVIKKDAIVMIGFEISWISPSVQAHCHSGQNQGSVSRKKGRNESGPTASAHCLSCTYTPCFCNLMEAGKQKTWDCGFTFFEGRRGKLNSFGYLNKQQVLP